LANTLGLISIIIPSYNHRQYIGEAVRSVLSQTYEDIELIVIDDGSQDGSPDFIATIKDGRVKLVRQANQGAPAAINRGLEMANGDFLAILNSDDSYHPRRLEKAIVAFQRDKDLKLVSSWIDVTDADGHLIGRKKGWENLEPWPLRRPDASFKRLNDFRLNLLATNFVSTTSNIIFRRSLYDQVGGMRNLRYVHDWDFLLRASEIAKCDQISEPLLRYRIHRANTIASDRKGMLFEICWVMAANIHRFEGKFVFASTDSKVLASDIEKLYESTNFQGNDKLIWVIRSFIEGQKFIGRQYAEESLLDDAVLREKFISLVNDDAQNRENNSGVSLSSFGGLLRKWKQLLSIRRHSWHGQRLRML
jgi:glycosyltransferase involved in cell wall biosynthesis